MRSSRILLALLGCLLATSLLIVQAQEGECVANEHGECINPDAPQEEVQEAVHVETEDPVVEEPVATEEVQAEAEAVPEEPVESRETVTEAEAPVEEEAPPAEEEAPVVDHEAPPPVEEAPPPAVEAEAVPDPVVEEEEATPPVVEEEPPVVEEESVPEETVTVTDDAPKETEPAATESAEENSPGCPSRASVIKCSALLDTDNNGELSREELQTAIDKLPWWSRGILSILGSVNAMMTKCDVDGDDSISLDFDMKHNGKTCLATCFKRRAFKAAFFPDCE